MRRFATTLCAVASILCAAAVRPAGAQQLLFDYVGFDYESPIVVPNTFGGVGNGYVGLGEIPTLQPPLVSDQTNFEYTYVLTGLTSVTRLVNGDFVVVTYGGPGTLTVYEDSRGSGTPFDYGTNPPNPTAPSTFNDGTAILVGAITNFRYIYSTLSGSGSYDSDFEAVGGTQLGNIPLNQRKGWQFAGVTRNTISVPAGYAHQVDGQTFLQEPTTSKSASWGQIKRIYR